MSNRVPKDTEKRWFRGGDVLDFGTGGGRRGMHRRAAGCRWRKDGGAGVMAVAKRVMRPVTADTLVPLSESSGTTRLRQGRAGQGVGRIPSEQNLHPDAPDRPCGHGHHRVLRPVGKGLSLTHHRLLRRADAVDGRAGTASRDDPAAGGSSKGQGGESVHGRSLMGISTDGSTTIPGSHPSWHGEERMRAEFGTSIMNRRRRLGFMA